MSNNKKNELMYRLILNQSAANEKISDLLNDTGLNTMKRSIKKSQKSISFIKIPKQNFIEL